MSSNVKRVKPLDGLPCEVGTVATRLVEVTAMGSWCNAMREEGTLLVLGSEKVKT